MPDDQQDQSAGASANNAGAGEGQQKGADDKSKANTTDAGTEGAGAGKEGGEGGQKDHDKDQEGKNAKAPEKKETQTDDEIDDGAEPLVKPRLSKKDFIIQRQQKKLAKKEKANDDEKNDETDEDDEVAPEDEATINKVVSKTFAPIIDKTLAADDDKEIADFIKDNPDFKPFEAKVRRFMQHPSRRSLPIKSIFYEVAGDKLIKIGADRAIAADKKAKETQTGGGSNRAGEGDKSDWNLSKEEFEAKQERIRHSQTQ